MLPGLNTNDAEALSRCLRDVVALSTLPAMWSGAEPVRIAESLAASLYTVLSPNCIYVCLVGVPGGEPYRIVQTNRYASSPALAAELGALIDDWAKLRDPDEVLILPAPHKFIGQRVAARTVGYQGELGVIAALYSDEESPTAYHQLLLNVAATQAATAVKGVHLLHSLKESEERVRRVNLELADRVDELERLHSQLRAADQRKDEFLATLAHELRNPLAPIRTGLEIMKLADGDPQAREEMRIVMERQAQLMMRLIDDLLDVSRITRGILNLRKTAVKVHDVLRDAVEAVRPAFDKANHEYHMVTAEEPLVLEADACRLAQAIANLLGNAAKYTPSNGRIVASVERIGSDVLISISDNGIGIPKEMCERIFDMFVQVDGSPEKEHSGLGIGLTIVKSMIEMHGGRVWAESEGPGRGSTFRVQLPLIEWPSESQQALDSDSSRISSERRRVLVVDDNKDGARTLSLMVEMLGNEVCLAHNGVEAIQRAEEFRPDIVLMDIGMPHINGYEAARSIRQKPWGRAMRLIAITGWGQDDDRRRSKEAGFDDHLVKPVEPDCLIKCL